LGEVHIVDVTIYKLFVLESEPSTVNLIRELLIGSAVVLISLHRLTGAGTGGLDGHTFCYSAKDNSLGDVCGILCHVTPLTRAPRMARNIFLAQKVFWAGIRDSYTRLGNFDY
jgi:hypothetical protein